MSQVYGSYTGNPYGGYSQSGVSPVEPSYSPYGPSTTEINGKLVTSGEGSYGERPLGYANDYRQGYPYTPRPPATAKDAYMSGSPYYRDPRQEYLHRGTTQPVSVPPIYGVPSYSQPYNRPMKTQYSQSPYGQQVARNRQIMNEMRRREHMARQRQIEARRRYGGTTQPLSQQEMLQRSYAEAKQRMEAQQRQRMEAMRPYGSTQPLPQPLDDWGFAQNIGGTEYGYQPTPVDRYRAGGYGQNIGGTDYSMYRKGLPLRGAY